MHCGDMTRFWDDKWLGGDRTLMDKFPTLYQVSNQQQQTIRLMGSHKEEEWGFEHECVCDFIRHFVDEPIYNLIS